MQKSLASTGKNVLAAHLLGSLVNNTGDLLIIEVGVATGGRLAFLGRLLREGGASRASLVGFDLFDASQAYSSEDFEPNFKRKLASEQKLSRAKGLATGADIRQVDRLVRWHAGERCDVHLVKGKAEITIPQFARTHLQSSRIDFLAISVNFYLPVRAALLHLEPRIRSGGILILDGVGFWEGFRKAVDKFNLDGYQEICQIEDAVFLRKM